jgi:hypothetical protein
VARKKPLPLAVGVAVTGTSILIAMAGVAFLTYALYRGLIAAFWLPPWAAALATGGGALVAAGIFTWVAGAYTRWKHGMRHGARRAKDPKAYGDRIETEIDSRVDPQIRQAIFAYPKGAVALGLAVGIATGASKDLRKLLVRMARQSSG